MANPFANSLPLARGGGGGAITYYAKQVVIPAAEGDLISPANAGVANLDPVPVDANLAIVAIVEFFCQGEIVTNTTYVVMQTDLGDGNWIDLAWCTFTGTTGVATFTLSAGAAGANAFQNSRSIGSAPSPANGSNQCPLGTRIQFVGKSTLNTTTSSSSNAPGVVSEVLVNIIYKWASPR